MKLKFSHAKKLFFVLIFGIIALIAYQINFSSLLGVENQSFTLFQFFGPIAGAFLGPLFGAASVLTAELINFLVIGKAFSVINLFRLAPMLLAAYYFGRKDSKLVALVPIACMILFVLHPVGGEAWYYSLYWVIPLVATFFPKKLFLKSLGTTFTAHAVGSTLFLYTIPTSALLWQGLIPVVAFERILFALGITASYIGMNTVLARVEHLFPNKVLEVNQKYILSKKLFGLGA